MSLEVLRIAGSRPYPPRVSAFTRTFWDGLAEGVFRATSCPACGRLTFPPKPFCPHCLHDKPDWVELSGDGVLYAYTVVHIAPAGFTGQVPYRVGIVDLAEGLRIACAIRPDGDIAPDRPVRLVVLAHDDGPLFAARLVEYR